MYYFIEKVCADIDSVTRSNMTVVKGTNDKYIFGNNVTLECAEGYAFSVNNDKVTTQKQVFCEDNANSTSGKWSDTGSCECTLFLCFYILLTYYWYS